MGHLLCFSGSRALNQRELWLFIQEAEIKCSLTSSGRMMTKWDNTVKTTSGTAGVLPVCPASHPDLYMHYDHCSHNNLMKQLPNFIKKFFKNPKPKA